MYRPLVINQLTFKVVLFTEPVHRTKIYCFSNKIRKMLHEIKEICLHNITLNKGQE